MKTLLFLLAVATIA